MRVEDWPQRLSEFLEQQNGQPHHYGAFVCAMFGADWVLTATGVDHAAEYRGREFTPMSAARIIAGFGSLEAMITSMLEREPKPPSFARRGDIVLAPVPIDDGTVADCIGICVGSRCAFRAAIGLRDLPLSAARVAWSVG